MDHNTKYLMCKSHEEKLMPIYCEECECPVCMTCITTSHLQHKINKASSFIQARHEELMESLYGENSLIEKMKNELICKRKTLEDRKIKLIEEIKNREETIVAEVRDIGKQFTETVFKAVSECEEKIQENEKEIDNLSVIPDFDTETETNCIKILQCHSELRRLERETQIYDPVNVTLKTDTNLSREQIEDLFGSVVVQHDFYLSSDEDRQIERESPFHDKTGRKILFCKKKIKDQENRVICFQFQPQIGGKYQLKEILFHGGKMFMHIWNKLFVAIDDTSTKEILPHVDGCFGLSSGHGILFIWNKRSTLSLYLHNGKCLSLFSVKKPQNELILAVEENEKLGISLLTEKSYQGFSSTHYELSMYRVDKNGEADNFANSKSSPFVEYENSEVAKLCVLKSTGSQIAIICRKSLQVYDQQLSTLFTYNGSARNSICSSFLAAFACLDQDDNILAANKKDNSVHMLDTSGQFLRIVVWPEDRLSFIISLSVDREGWLWCFGMNSEGSYLHLFDYEYLKTTDRTKRAITETEENFKLK